MDNSWPLVIELSEPIQLGEKGTPITSISVREPVLGDLAGVESIAVQGISQVKMDDVIAIAGRLTGLAPTLIKKIPGEAAQRLLKVSRDFLVGCL